MFYAALVNNLECVALLLANMSTAFAIDNEGNRLEDVTEDKAIADMLKKGKMFQVVVKFMPAGERATRLKEKGLENFEKYII